jgi:hypothetical protein
MIRTLMMHAREVAAFAGSGKCCGLTNRWSGRVLDKVLSSYAGARAAQLKR